MELNPQGRVGLFISGGIDSTLLRLLLEEKTTILRFNITSDSGVDTVPNTISFHWDSGRKGLFMAQTMTHVHEEYELDEIYVAVNKKYPQLADLPDAPHPPEQLGYDYSLLPVLSPFEDIYKHETMQLAIDKGIDIDKLNSCIRYIEEACGECYNCKERALAHEILQQGSQHEFFSSDS